MKKKKSHFGLFVVFGLLFSIIAPVGLAYATYYDYVDLTPLMFWEEKKTEDPVITPEPTPTPKPTPEPTPEI